MTPDPPTATEFPLAVDRITSSTVMVTPDMAKRWLEHNKKNRTISPTVVAKYSNDMKSGLWTFAADPVRFDIDGHLIDGQHRLTALSESGVTIPMLVIRGLHPDAQLVMDQGRKRTSGQQLGLYGIKNSSNVAASVKFLIMWELGYLFRDNKIAQSITTPVIVEYVETHAADIEFFQKNIRRITQVDVPPSISGAFFIMANRIDPAGAAEFLSQVYSMTGMSEGHPILTLDRRLRKIRRESLNTPYRDYLAFLILAWNAWRDGRRMTKFQRPWGGSWSVENFPEMR